MSASTITRRAALTGTVAGAAAIVAGAVPALADHSPDPIFAAIEAHKAAVLRHDAAVEVEFALEEELPKEAQQSWITKWQRVIVFSDDPRWIAAITARDETCDAADAMAWGLLENPPVTIAGAAALMAYADSACDAGGPLREGWFPDDWQEAAYRTIARASLGLAAGAA